MQNNERPVALEHIAAETTVTMPSGERTTCVAEILIETSYMIDPVRDLIVGLSPGTCATIVLYGMVAMSTTHGVTSGKCWCDNAPSGHDIPIWFVMHCALERANPDAHVAILKRKMAFDINITESDMALLRLSGFEIYGIPK